MATTATLSERSNHAIGVLSQLISSTLSNVSAPQIVDSLPWAEFFPADVRRRFVHDFLRTARACAEVGNFDRLGVALEAWKGTAEAYAAGIDPSGSDLTYLDPEPVQDPRAEA